jgi:hypothetical protein
VPEQTSDESGQKFEVIEEALRERAVPPGSDDDDDDDDAAKAVGDDDGTTPPNGDSAAVGSVDDSSCVVPTMHPFDEHIEELIRRARKQARILRKQSGSAYH